MAQINPVDALIQYILETKPYSTKILDVTTEYTYDEDVEVSFTESWTFDIFNTESELECSVGYGTQEFGYLNLYGSPTNAPLPLNPLYDPLSVNYVPQLDRNNELYDPLFLLSSPLPTQDQKDASLVYYEYIEGVYSSNWDNEQNTCPPDQNILVASIADELELEADRLCSFDYDFYLPYDSIDAYEYTENNGTATQINITVNPQTYVTTVVNLFVHADTPWPCGYGSPSSPLPEWVPYVDFYINYVNVDPSMFSVGVIAIDENEILDWPYVTPSNNSQLIGYYSNDYGFKADGNGLQNNITTPFVQSYTNGDTIRVAIDFPNSQVNFYKVVANIPIFMGSYPLADNTKTYTFAAGMLNDATGSQVSLVTLIVPPPLYLNLVPGDYQSQLNICSLSTTYLEAVVDTNVGFPIVYLWEQLNVPPDTPVVLNNANTAIANYVPTDQQDNIFRVTVMPGDPTYEQFLDYFVTRTPTSNLTMAFIDNSQIINEKTLGVEDYPQTLLRFYNYNYTQPIVSNPFTWYQNLVPTPGGGFQSYHQFVYQGDSFPIITSDPSVYVSTMVLYKLTTLEWEKIYVEESPNDLYITSLLEEGETYRIDTTYSRHDDVVSQIVVGEPFTVTSFPDKVLDIIDVISNQTFGKILNFTEVQTFVEELLYVDQTIVEPLLGGGGSRYSFNTSTNDDQAINNETIPTPLISQGRYLSVELDESIIIGG